MTTLITLDKFVQLNVLNGKRLSKLYVIETFITQFYWISKLTYLLIRLSLGWLRHTFSDNSNGLFFNGNFN